MTRFCLAKSLPIVLGLTLLAMGQARAASVGPLSTGVDVNGAPLANGAADPNWTVTANTTGEPNTPPGQDQAVTSGYPVPPWYDPSAHGLSARWITPSPANFSGFPNGEIDYSQTFGLGGNAPGQVNIALSLTADDMVSNVLVNGHALGITTTDQGYATLFGPFAIPTADLVSGNNTIVVETQNTHGGAEGLLVSVATIVIPEPGSIVLLVTGLGGLFTFRRFVRRPVGP